MKNVFKKQNVMPVLVLGVICIVVAALLGGVNMITAPEIEEQRLIAANAGKSEVLEGLDPTTAEEIAVEPGKYPTEIKKISKFDKGYVFESEVKGNASGMVVLCGVGNDGKVTGVKVLSNGETPSYWETVYPVVTGKDGKYNGQSAEDLSAEIVSGATNSSTGVYKAVKASLDAFTVISGGEIVEDEEEEETVTKPSFKSDDEVLALAKELVGEGAEFTDVTTNGSDLVHKIYKENNGGGYVAYVGTISSYYNIIDTENLIHIDSDGKIKNVKKLTWIVSEGKPEANYYPPSEEKLAQFYNGLVGKDSETIGGVDLSTGATNTTSVLVKTITDALTEVDRLIKADLPRSEDEVKAIAKEMAGEDISLVSFTLIKDAPDALKLAYSAGEDGYFLYIVVPGEYVPIATEAVVHLSKDCEVIKVNLLSWVVGNGIDPEDFADRFAGKDKNSIGGVDLVTEATVTSADFRTALEASVISVADGDGAKETLLKLRMESMVPNADGFEKLSLPEDAPKTVKAIYKVLGYDGYVVYTMTSTQYIELETEALFYVNAKGEIGNVYLVTWNVGHGVGAGDFPESLIGLNAKSLKEVELVTDATGTSGNLRDAALDALSVVPIDRIPAIVGIVVLVLSVASFVAYIVVIKTSRRRK